MSVGVGMHAGDVKHVRLRNSHFHVYEYRRIIYFCVHVGRVNHRNSIAFRKTATSSISIFS